MFRILLISALSLMGFKAFSQFEGGIFTGISNYQGDLVDKVYRQSRFAAGITLGYQFSPKLSIRAGLTFGKAAGADSLNKEVSLRARNLSFESGISELAVRAEFYTFDLDSKRWSPYVFGGIAIYHFDPYARDQNDNKIYLKPLTTEGQGLPGYTDAKPYSLTQAAIPFGGGVKFMVSDNVGLSLEIGLRKLFTDYLDDVSTNYASSADLLAARGQRSVDFAYRGDEISGSTNTYPAKGETRGSAKYKDYYYFSGLHLTYKFGDGGGGGGRNSKYGCPRF